jgi:DNA (cytosine-5)-methyltransferase 1
MTVESVATVPQRHSATPRVAEFFAGIGLVRLALESEGFRVVFANDIERAKKTLYAANFPNDDFRLCDVRDLSGDDVPDADLATASFPCTDLSLAGNRAGLKGRESSMFWEFARVMEEMADRRPPVILLENVPSFATSRGGADLHRAITRLNDLGYWCDLFVADARLFVPQSRPRLFIVGAQEQFGEPAWWASDDSLRPSWITAFASRHPELRLCALPLRAPTPRAVPRAASFSGQSVVGG